MTRKDIMERFNFPEENTIRDLEAQKGQLIKQINKINNDIGKLKTTLDKKADIVADKLDKDFPDWRKVLVKTLKELSEQD